MAIRRGLETAALLVALSACTNKVEEGIRARGAVLTQVADQVRALAAMPNDCDGSQPDLIICRRETPGASLTFKAKSKGEKNLEIKDAEKSSWEINVDGSCEEGTPSFRSTIPGAEGILGKKVFDLYDEFPCKPVEDPVVAYKESYDARLKRMTDAIKPHEEALQAEIQGCVDRGEKAIQDAIDKSTKEFFEEVCNTSYGTVQMSYSVGVDDGEADRILDLGFRDEEYSPHIRISPKDLKWTIRLESGASAIIASKALKDLSPQEKAFTAFLDKIQGPSTKTDFIWLADIHPRDWAVEADKALLPRVQAYQKEQVEAWLKAHPGQRLGIILEGSSKTWQIPGSDWAVEPAALQSHYPQFTDLSSAYGARLVFTGTDSEADIQKALQQDEAITRLHLASKAEGCLSSAQIADYEQQIEGIKDRWTTAAAREVTAALEFSKHTELGGVVIVSGLYHGPYTQSHLTDLEVKVAPGLPSMTDRPTLITPPLCPPVRKSQEVVATP